MGWVFIALLFRLLTRLSKERQPKFPSNGINRVVKVLTEERVPVLIWRIAQFRRFKVDRRPLSVFFFYAADIAPPCNRWCDVLGFVPASSVSSSSTLQIFEDAILSHLWWFLRSRAYGNSASQHFRSSEVVVSLLTSLWKKIMTE